jgi:hypothetical protein
MKFSIRNIVGAFALVAVTIAPSLVNACERECQQNVSHAFEDKYISLSKEYFAKLSTKVSTELFYGIPENVISETEKVTVYGQFQESINTAETAWSATLFKTIFDTIFKDEPKFKGDCNHPKRVQQPPIGIWWKMEDCHNMDYICGNPPSICHFMPMIKTRIVKKLIGQLQERMDGDNSDVYSNYLEPTLNTAITTVPALADHTAILHANLNQILGEIKESLLNFASVVEWPKQWDLEIKNMLLTFP